MKWNDDSALEKDIQTSSLSTAEEKEEKKFSSVPDFWKITTLNHRPGSVSLMNQT